MQGKSVRASHILLKSNQSRNPMDRVRNKQITRSDADAEKGIREIRAQVENNLNLFAKIAQDRSECSSCQKGGDLGEFTRGQMQKQFEDVAFALKVGELSQPVKSDSGWHIILRTG
ncbi:unnamed protein product [Paramecium sonneborni]|uniref:Peptidyl-prolyl cis-trans isomerase n=1 Tax=Paramecium sonneborni TaxID=65129 RepID=A0A8S1RJ64_9CILI|nr:unnamed protein product [Paramecium sonneborni]